MMQNRQKSNAKHLKKKKWIIFLKKLDVWKKKKKTITDCYKYNPALSQEITQTITNYLDDLKTVEEF